MGIYVCGLCVDYVYVCVFSYTISIDYVCISVFELARVTHMPPFITRIRLCYWSVNSYVDIFFTFEGNVSSNYIQLTYMRIVIVE